MAIWKKQPTYVPMVKCKKFNTSMIANDYNIQQSKENEEKEIKNQKLENFKQRLLQFNSVQTLDEAKSLLDKIMPIALDRVTFFIGDARVIIVNYESRLRICLNSPKEFIVYDFV